MTFWSDPNLEPKRTYRWIAVVDFKVPLGSDGDLNVVGNSRSLGLQTSPFIIKQFTRPKLVLNHEITINSQTSAVTYAYNDLKWDDISISIYDIQNAGNKSFLFPDEPSIFNNQYNTTRNIWTWLTENGYDPDALTGLGDFGPFNSAMNNADNAGGGIATLKILHIDSEGKQYESWEFQDPRLVSVDFGQSANYEKDEIQQIDLRFHVISCVYKTEQ
jgi:hypothetical protein